MNINSQSQSNNKLQQLLDSILTGNINQQNYQQNTSQIQQRQRNLIKIDVYGDLITIDLDNFTHDTDLISYILKKQLCPDHYKDLCCILYYTNNDDAKILKSIAQITVLSDKKYNYKFQILNFPCSDIKLNLLHGGFLRMLCKQEMEYIIDDKSLIPSYEQSLQIAAYCCQAYFGMYKQESKKHNLAKIIYKYIPSVYYDGKNKQSRNKSETCKKIIKIWQQYSNNQIHSTYLDLLSYIQRNVSYSLYYIFSKFDGYNIHVTTQKIYVLDKQFNPVLKDENQNISIQYSNNFLIINHSFGQLYIHSNKYLIDQFIDIYNQLSSTEYPSFLVQGRICDTTSEDGQEIPTDLLFYNDNSTLSSQLRYCAQTYDDIDDSENFELSS